MQVSLAAPLHGRHVYKDEIVKEEKEVKIRLSIAQAD